MSLSFEICSSTLVGLVEMQRIIMICPTKIQPDKKSKHELCVLVLLKSGCSGLVAREKNRPHQHSSACASSAFHTQINFSSYSKEMQMLSYLILPCCYAISHGLEKIKRTKLDLSHTKALVWSCLRLKSTLLRGKHLTDDVLCKGMLKQTNRPTSPQCLPTPRAMHYMALIILIISKWPACT